MKVLITGGAGYLGSVMTGELLKSGHEVIVLDNFMYNQNSLMAECINEKLTIIRGDARDEKLLKSNIEKVDAIFPLACLTGAPLCNKFSQEAKSVIVDAVELILKLRNKNQMIIYPTTNSGYGLGEKGKFCTEETPLRPISLYGKLKVEAEESLLQSGNAITLRLATAFGISPRMRLDLLVNDFTYRAVNDRFLVLFEAGFKRNYIHVRDVAQAFMHSLSNFNSMKNQAYNVGLSDANLSKWELCEEIKKLVPDFYFEEAKIGEDPDKRDYIVSNEKLEKTGFKQKFPLQMGLKELVKGYQIIKRNQYANI
ncbi:MAG: NAD-dependent epimerase/dehydratase family protein [Candidatus Omnitrophica bacterium]|nr:NAD-dependent epimerase/dehydratase family protein [Candidatus Omnitrophota bacterium]